MNAADGNSFAVNYIVLAQADYTLTNTSLGQIVVSDANTNLLAKSLTIEGAGQGESIISSGVDTWHNRLFDIQSGPAALETVAFQNLTISGGNAVFSGTSISAQAAGGAILVQNASVSLTNVTLSGNVAQGTAGAAGASGLNHGVGGDGGRGSGASGGAIFVDGGSLTLVGDVFEKNMAVAGAGGAGGTGAPGVSTGHVNNVQRAPAAAKAITGTPRRAGRSC